MDDTAIRQKLNQRNTIRRAAHLPPLDLQKEYDKEVKVAAAHEYWRIRRLYAAEEADILKSVFEEGRRIRGPDADYPRGVFGWMSVRIEVTRRLEALLVSKGVLEESQRTVDAHRKSLSEFYRERGIPEHGKPLREFFEKKGMLEQFETLNASFRKQGMPEIE